MLAEAVLKLLKASEMSLSMAESCTGGLVSSHLTAIPGASEVFREGFITYSNEAKAARLGVSREILETHGAVSEAAAAAMAEGAAKTAGANVGLSTTGFAGPGGGDGKPAGRVYVGLHIVGRGTATKKFNINGSRNEVRARAAILALDFLKKSL